MDGPYCINQEYRTTLGSHAEPLWGIRIGVLRRLSEGNWMWSWLSERLRAALPQSLWSVAIRNDSIVTTDGTGATRIVLIADLMSIVVATDDSGPWDADVVFMLYGGGSDVLTIFPLEAQGCQDFVKWMAKLPGYCDREFKRAMGSTNIARFVAWTSLR